MTFIIEVSEQTMIVQRADKNVGRTQGDHRSTSEETNEAEPE
jgi:hypothetical protein